MKKEILNLKDINFRDERFRTSYFFSLEKLKLSLDKIGLIHPPLVSYKNNHFILVSGWKRVLACLQLNLSSIPVLVVKEDDELKTFLMAFYENLATRDFSLLEKAEFLKKLKKFGEDEKYIVKYYLPLLNIPSTLYHLEIFFKISQFKLELKKFIHEKNMPFNSLELITGFNSFERKLLLPFLMPLSQNKQKEILENLQEISLRDSIPAWKLLKSKEIIEVEDSEKLSPLQKADNVRFILKKKRYPHFYSWKDAFNSSLKKVSWPKDIAIDHSPFFEDETIDVHFKFKNGQEFKNCLLKLQEIASKKEFSRIFNFSSYD